jgi:hypothetical protein
MIEPDPDSHAWDDFFDDDECCHCCDEVIGIGASSGGAFCHACNDAGCPIGGPCRAGGDEP